jgi:hypothetical protein
MEYLEMAGHSEISMAYAKNGRSAVRCDGLSWTAAGVSAP